MISRGLRLERAHAAELPSAIMPMLPAIPSWYKLNNRWEILTHRRTIGEKIVAVALPTPDQLRAVADQCGLALTDEDVTSFRGLLRGPVDAYNVLDAMPDEVPVVKYPRTPGYRPGPEENPRNAWYRKSTVKGAASGKLKGKVVALKDNIMLAGVPMMNGSSTLEGYFPDFDATIVTRMLDAGAEIAGKTHCELFCISGGSHTNRPGRCIIRTRWDSLPAAPRREARSWSRSARSTWRSAATRAARSGCRHRSAAPTG